MPRDSFDLDQISRPTPNSHSGASSKDSLGGLATPDVIGQNLPEPVNACTRTRSELYARIAALSVRIARLRQVVATLDRRRWSWEALRKRKQDQTDALTRGSMRQIEVPEEAGHIVQETLLQHPRLVDSPELAEDDIDQPDESTPAAMVNVRIARVQDALVEIFTKPVRPRSGDHVELVTLARNAGRAVTTPPRVETAVKSSTWEYGRRLSTIVECKESPRASPTKRR